MRTFICDSCESALAFGDDTWLAGSHRVAMIGKLVPDAVAAPRAADGSLA
jgi:hypothetical protein